MDNLWTPWRMAYIKRERDDGDRCVFCAMADGSSNGASVHVIGRSSHCFVTMNSYPYSNGHVMIVPNLHVPSPEELPTEALSDLMMMTNRSLRVLRHVCQPSAFNIGANIGTDAGAGIAAHYHFHVVPRWSGDVNFMTSIANTRVIPNTLKNLYQELKAVWDELYNSDRAES